MVKRITVSTAGQGLHEITDQVRSAVREAGLDEGLCTVMVQHTSASLIVQENADPAARRDLENWLNGLVREDDTSFTHTTEGPDDMPSHIKSALTATSVAIPIVSGQLGLGTWQGIFLWEHRHRGSRRHLLVHISS
jgi:secondary thiamine-phosphate synthase enzyme